MRFALLPGVLVLSLALASTALHADHETSSVDLLRMRKGGLKEGTILDFLRTYRATLVLRGQDAADLIEAGFSEAFIRDLIEYTRTQPPPGDHSRGGTAEPEDRPHRGSPEPEGRPDPYASTTFYVSYGIDPWVFPFWFYDDWHHHGGYYLGSHYFGWGHRSLGFGSHGYGGYRGFYGHGSYGHSSYGHGFSGGHGSFGGHGGGHHGH